MSGESSPGEQVARLTGVASEPLTEPYTMRMHDDANSVEPMVADQAQPCCGWPRSLPRTMICRRFSRIWRTATGGGAVRFVGLVLHDAAKQVMQVHVLETAEARRVTRRLDGLEMPMKDSASWLGVGNINNRSRFPADGGNAVSGRDGRLRGIGMQSRLLLSAHDRHAPGGRHWVRQFEALCL